MAHEHHEHYSARPHPEFVVLEIGDELGALIVHTGPDMHGVEIEISPSSEEESRTHKQVLERVTRGLPAYTAVFDRLRKKHAAGEDFTPEEEKQLEAIWRAARPKVRDEAAEGRLKRNKTVDELFAELDKLK